MQYALLAQMLLELYLKIKPEIQREIAAGQVSPEVQQNLKTYIDAIRSGEAFQGPQWQKEPDPVP